VACGSQESLQDVLDAVDHVTEKEDGRIDGRRIYVAGILGGGHMALLMAT